MSKQSHTLCPHCREIILDSDKVVDTPIGTAHSTCSEQFIWECEEEALKYAEMERRELRREKKLIAKLKRTLKPKVWAAIELVRADSTVNYMKLETIDKVRGTKNKAGEWFGESVGVKTVYDDTSFCSYSDSYSGPIWLAIGKGIYLHIHISG
jgi:hypothetical protein